MPLHPWVGRSPARLWLRALSLLGEGLGLLPALFPLPSACLPAGPPPPPRTRGWHKWLAAPVIGDSRQKAVGGRCTARTGTCLCCPLVVQPWEPQCWEPGLPAGNKG